MIPAPERWPMAQDRLVAVSYPADADYVRINTEVLADDAEIVYTHELDDAQAAEVLRRAEVLVAWELPREVPPGALGEASRLRLVQLLSAGVDAVDFSAVPDRLVLTSNAGAYAAAMSEHGLAMTLCLAKRLPQRHAALAAGRPVEFVGTLADRGRVLAVADVLVISLPLTLATHGLLGGRELALMKPAAIVVNVARGPIIDQGALYEHLRANPQFGAGIDTWWDEPTGDAPFRADYPFFDLPNLIGSPHNSSIVPGTSLPAARVA